MAPAVLSTLNEPSLHGQCGAVFMRKFTKQPLPDNINNNPNPNFDSNKQFNDSLNYRHYATFNISTYTPSQLKELKKRLTSELEQIRIFRERIEQKPKKRCNPFPPEDTHPKRLSNPESEKSLTVTLNTCSQMLVKLMKHKWAWVFNTPVDVMGLGLHDYNLVVKKPMDLGTVKSNLENGFYDSPIDFAEDVRLTFTNAMSYNPRGQDVYFMAEKLLEQFDLMFNPVFKKFEAQQLKLDSVKPLQQPTLSVEQSPRGRTPSPLQTQLEPLVGAAPDLSKGRRVKMPKPKAKDPNKRLMTMEEKGKLGVNLQDLPPEKLGQLVQILRKRNGDLAQDGDEIELDIEAVDNETLWELDRFVTNYKKMVSKIKRQGFIQNVSTPNMGLEGEMGSAEKRTRRGDAGEEDVDIGEDMPIEDYPSVEIERDGTGVAGGASSGSSSSGSSSSSSGSSSSDSGSGGSSSGSDSEADSVQSPFVEAKEAQ
ncbi:unnamed protein product [Eruca vesicaria subsp. sativa]|uniref:Uncharacterized protein n=1 Tax=Eruca vesicaria subsp. sativa TaxID=29727 RepID=A0ABC8L4M7_ERUVS|nr:unnamed protein product [Eruca vesicaria subsp. sativa]